jgi:hypothetical protein
MNIPDGWQLVPKEPDDSMLLQANCGVSKTYDKKHGHIIGCTVDFRNSYKAMLSAAPSAPSVERGVSEIVERLARALLEWEWGHDPVWEETQPAAKANYRDRAHWLIKKMRLPVADARNEGIEEALKKIKSYVLIENPDNFPEDTEIMASEIWAIIRPLFPELKSPPAEGKAK